MSSDFKVCSHPLPNNGTNHASPANSKRPSISSSTTGSVTSPGSDKGLIKKRMESLTDEDIIQKNLQELMDKKNREERKANGRLVAVILASLVIFLAIYHAWIKKSGMLAGVLVPAVIMLSFGGWIVILAKRDKAKRALFDRYLEEVAQKNKQELEAKKSKSHRKGHDRSSSNETIVQYVNEISKDGKYSSTQKLNREARSKEHRKHRKYMNVVADISSNDSSSSSCSKQKALVVPVHKDLRSKRPSIRQKLFRQAGLHNISGSRARATNNTTQSLAKAVIDTPTVQSMTRAAAVDCPDAVGTKRQRLQRLEALTLPPPMQRTGSVP